MVNKLTKLIQQAVGGCAEYWAGLIAEHLIKNGVTILPKIGDTYYEISVVCTKSESNVVSTAPGLFCNVCATCDKDFIVNTKTFNTQAEVYSVLATINNSKQVSFVYLTERELKNALEDLNIKNYIVQ